MAERERSGITTKGSSPVEAVAPSPYPAQIELSEHAENYITQLAIDLDLALVELHQLPASLRSFYYLAESRGAERGRRSENDRLSPELDRLYLLAYNSTAQVQEIQQRRLDGHFEEAERRFFSNQSGTPDAR